MRLSRRKKRRSPYYAGRFLVPVIHQENLLTGGRSVDEYVGFFLTKAMGMILFGYPALSAQHIHIAGNINQEVDAHIMERHTREAWGH